MAKANNCNVIFFATDHCHAKKNDDQNVNDTNLLNVHHGDGSISPGILYYCKKMPACLLTNFSTQLDIFNEAQTLMSEVIFNSQGNLLYFNTFNFAYYCPSFLHTTEQQYMVQLTSSYIHFVTY